MRSMRCALVCTFVVLASGCSKDQPRPTAAVSGPGPVASAVCREQDSNLHGLAPSGS